MVERIRRHLAHNAIAYLALFFALTGSAYAAVKVGSGQVADNSLRSVDGSSMDYLLVGNG